MRPLEKAAEYDESLAYAADGLYPYYCAFDEVDGVEVVRNGHRYLLASSSDYLGLSRDPRVVEAAKAAIDRYGAGRCGSRLLNGSLDIHERLEGKLAALMGKEAALLFSTGYQANLGTLQALLASQRYPVIFDRDVHASLYDGAALAGAEVLRFGHNRLEDLERELDKSHEEHGGAAMVAVDSVYSMDGSLCPLREVAELCAARGVDLLVDEAHAVGTVAPGGLAAALKLRDRVPIVTGTLSKSLASMGGFVAASRRVVEHIRNHARPLIFTAAPSPAEVAAGNAALDIMLAEPERMERLRHVARRMAELLKGEGIEGVEGVTPIIAIPVGTKAQAAWAAKMLLDRGIVVYPVVNPAVPAGRCLLRVSLTAQHEERHVATIAAAIGEVVRAMRKARA